MDKSLKLINKIVASIILIGTIIFMIKDPRTSRMLTYLSVIPLILVPVIVRKFICKLESVDITIYYIFIFFAYLLGCCANLYNKTANFDSIMHFSSGVYTMFIALKLSNYKKISDKVVKLIFCFGFIFMVAGIWEICEFSADKILHTRFQHNETEGVNDTMIDIIMAFIGSIITYIFYNIKKKVVKS
mgnify:CR=1 FL=1